MHAVHCLVSPLDCPGVIPVCLHEMDNKASVMRLKILCSAAAPGQLNSGLLHEVGSPPGSAIALLAVGGISIPRLMRRAGR